MYLNTQTKWRQIIRWIPIKNSRKMIRCIGTCVSLLAVFHVLASTTTTILLSGRQRRHLASAGNDMSLLYTHEELQLASAETRQQLQQLLSWLESPTRPCQQLHQLLPNDFICDSWQLKQLPKHKNNNGSSSSSDSSGSSSGECVVYSFTVGQTMSAHRQLEQQLQLSYGCRLRSFDPALAAAAAREARESGEVRKAAKAAAIEGATIYGTVLHVASSAQTRPRRVTLDSAWRVLDSNNNNTNSSCGLPTSSSCGGHQLRWLRVHVPGAECLLLAQQLRGQDDTTLMLHRVSYMSVDVTLPTDLATLSGQFRVDILADGLASLGELGFRLVHSRRREPLTSHRRHTRAIYRVLLERSGRDVWDRMERRRPSRRDYTELNLAQVLAL